MLVIFRKATPSAAQIKAGNYSKRKVAWNGLTISIENERGSVRRGMDRYGKTWSTTMRHAYGYLKGSQGVDGDQVDCYLGPKLKSAPMVYVVHQRKTGDWERYDEDKCMLGFPDEAAAKHAFLAHYDDPRFLGPVTALPVAEFVAKVKTTANQPRMLKARGWWSPAHGGTHGPHKRTLNVTSGLSSGGDRQVVATATGDELNELIARHANDRHPVQRAAAEWYRAHLQGRVAHRQDIGGVRFSKKGRDEFTSFGADEDKMRLVATLFDVVKNGRHVRREEVNHERTDKIVAFHVIDALVRLGNAYHLVRVEVGEHKDGHMFYDLFKDAEAHEAKKTAMRGYLETKSKPPHGLPSSASAASKVKLADKV